MLKFTWTPLYFNKSGLAIMESLNSILVLSNIYSKHTYILCENYECHDKHRQETTTL